jgi:hypothetical protein
MSSDLGFGLERDRICQSISEICGNKAALIDLVK